MSLWDDITEEELRTAAKVASASGGHVMAAAADSWRLRADLMSEMALRDQLRGWQDLELQQLRLWFNV